MNILTSKQVEDWRASIGRQRIEYQQLENQSLRRYALALGLSGEEAHPQLPHWAFFLPAPVDSELGEDGHPKRGGFLPDISLPRRMFAASTIEIVAPLNTGEEGRLTSTIMDVSHKTGSTGELIFVKVERVLWQDGADRIRETQTYVYRAAGDAVPMPEPIDDPPTGERWEPNAVNLFRFSAVTFNSHRIHYDRPYATGVEGYPSLVIHGPFTAAKLAGLAAQDGELSTFAFRAQAPLFLDQPVFLQKGPDVGQYCAVRADGITAMTAKVSFQ